MSMKFSDLQCREVICTCDGRRLGFVSDVLVELPEGQIHALVVPGPCRLWGIAGRHDDYIIPWSCVKKIGPDILLVDARPEDCRVMRQKQGLLF